MNILYYDTTVPYENLFKIVKQTKEVIGEDLIVLPKSFELLTDCSEKTLLDARDLIDKALYTKQTESC